MTKTIFNSLAIFCTFLMLLTSCSKESTLQPEVLDQATTNSAKLSLYIAETDELITVNSINEIKEIIQTNYNHLDYAQASIERLEAYQEEVAYSQTLDLENPIVEQKYANHLNQKYGDATIKAGNGILYDGQASGFLSVTNIPINLKKSKRNRASSWLGILGTTVLCERTWWRGRKVVVLGIGVINLANLDFDNETDSFF